MSKLLKKKYLITFVITELFFNVLLMIIEVVVDLLEYLLFLPIYQMTQEFKKRDMLLLLSKILFNFISACAFHQLIILKIIHRFYF
jgi:Na+/H+-dicarboxylate symporter